MPHASHTTTVDATYDEVRALLADKVDHPRKYVPVTSSTILERTDDHVLREMFQPYPVPLTIRERIRETAVDGGVDIVFEHVDNPTYTGSFHNTLRRGPDGVTLEYRMEWTPVSGADPMSDETAARMVRDGVTHLKHLAENPVQVPDWVRGFFDAVDSADLTAVAGLLTDDVRFRIGNGPELVGRAAAVAQLAKEADRHATTRHDHVDVTTVDDRAFVNGYVEHTTHDGEEHLFPSFTELRRREGRISTFLIFADTSPTPRSA
ncbi:ketosteroid isomerase-like protein [Saccharothrix carnea]|uniref:Ketosteroid isomerase-like protein n=1 Tax=Saccharothrix carnea TaxID=1280637 RepID=A0A2P8I0Y9_SACCR|nr:nuclear transport factor 2 family protein [Saccharothrix carnea]PSL52139.1 ketosteroid isomerase-like protein [Saccharothrix carnea]